MNKVFENLMHLTQCSLSKTSFELLQSNFTLVNSVKRSIVNIQPSISINLKKIIFIGFIFLTNTINAQAPTFGNTSTINICVNGSYYLNPSTTNGTFSSGDAAIATVNSSGYVTGVSEGTTTVSLEVTGEGTVTANIIVAASASASLAITDPLAEASYKFNNNPQGPVGGLNNYVGYNGFTYSSQARPIKPGYFRASKQLGNASGCPFEYDIFRCTTCGTVPEYATRPQGTITGNTIQFGDGSLTYTSTNGGGPLFTVVYVPSGGSNVSIPNITSGTPFSIGTSTSTTSYNLISITDQSTNATTDFSGVTTSISVVPPPTASLTGAPTICAGVTANLSLRTTGTGSITVTLSNGLVVNTISGTTSISVTPTITTPYSITSVSDISGSGTISGSSATVSVNPLTAISVQPLSTVTLVEGATLTLSVTATNATAYQWYKGVNLIPSANSPTYTTAITTAGAGTYYVTASGTCNTVTSVNAIVNVIPIPQGTLSGSFVNQGETGRLTYTSSNSPVGGPFTIVYLPSGGTNVTVTNVTSGVAFNVASGTPSTTTTYSLVSVTDETSTISRTSSVLTPFTGSSATINVTPVQIYGTVTSPYTSRIWMDRNLGASQVATTITDVNSYGDLYQWGRSNDGGQLRTALQVPTELPTVTTKSTNRIGKNPWTSQANWNNNTDPNGRPYQGIWEEQPWSATASDGGYNNPCPSGSRVPTYAEWNAELNGMIGAGLVNSYQDPASTINNAAGAFNSFLKIPQAGVFENYTNSLVTGKTVLWTTDRYDAFSSSEIRFWPTFSQMNANHYGFSYSVRCIMNVTAPTLTSTISSTINSYSAILGGALSSTGGERTSVRIIYSTDVNFTTSSTVTITSTASVGNVTTTITGLTPLTTYYAKAYAVNSAGSTFGSTISFTTGAPFQGPAIITSGLIAYLDASDGASYAGSGSTWTDKQGNANGTINGAVNFISNADASYFIFPGANNAYITSSVNQSIKDFTIVFEPDFSSFSYSGGHTLFSKQPGSDAGGLRFWSYNFADPINTNGNPNSVWGVPNDGIVDLDWAGNQTMYLNGLNQTSDFFPLTSGWNILGGSNRTSSWSSFPYSLGAGLNGRAFQGKIAFVLFYDRVLSAQDQLDNFNALKSRFGLMNATAPTLTSTITSTITSSSAILGGALTSTGGATTSVRIIYSTDVNFTTSSTVTITTYARVGNVTTTITGLSENTTYYAKAYAVNAAGSTFGSTISFTTSATPRSVGESFGGGIVFYVTDGGTHGLIAATTDETSTLTWDDAITACNNKITNTYTDWYLPSLDELALLYSNRTLIGLSAGSTGYWSSTPHDANSARGLIVDTNGIPGSYFTGNKSFTNLVRAIRAF